MSFFISLVISAVVLLGFVGWWFLSIPRLLRRLQASPVGTDEAIWRQVRARLAGLSRLHRLPEPELRVLPEFSPNALLLRQGRHAYIVLTEGLVRTLSAEELDAALALCLAHVYARGRSRQTLVSLALFPVAQALQSYPVVFYFFLSPFLTFLSRLSFGPAKTWRADLQAARHTSPFLVAAMLQKVSVLARKIRLERWSLALDSLFLVSPLGLELPPLGLYFLQPSVAQRRDRLLRPATCET